MTLWRSETKFCDHCTAQYGPEKCRGESVWRKRAYCSKSCSSKAKIIRWKSVRATKPSPLAWLVYRDIANPDFDRFGRAA